ncbi:hypothetical protein XENORESO_000798 [Xenotaenia resolanae]|uniref:Uncharacterized protein n=1 Tax=Xenotaenia resolanae TaxID=208358 RepID=A0ABV0WRC1_9TELE
MLPSSKAASSILMSPQKEPAALQIPALEIKLGALVVLLSVTLLFGFIPLCVVRGGGRCSVDPDFRRRLLSWISCFSGGVFLATCLLDLLPDYLQSINEAFRDAGIKVRRTHHQKQTQRLHTLNMFTLSTLTAGRICRILSVALKREYFLVGISISWKSSARPIFQMFLGPNGRLTGF